MRYEFDGGNLLVGGATKQGKTSFLKEMVADYLENKTSDEMEIIVLDTKGAMMNLPRKYASTKASSRPHRS